MEKKFVTLEAFKEYDKKIKEYVAMHDGLCPKCGAIITDDKCENCAKDESVKV